MMRKYILTQTVLAEHGHWYAANTMGAIIPDGTVPTAREKKIMDTAVRVDEGYLVHYQNGHIEWMEKESFDKVCRPAEADNE